MLAEWAVTPGAYLLAFTIFLIIWGLIIFGMFELFLRAIKTFIRACVRRGSWIDSNGRDQFDSDASLVYDDLQELIAHSVDKSLMLSKIYDKVVKEQESAEQKSDAPIDKKLFQQFHPVGTVLYVDGKYFTLVEDAPGKNACSTCGCCFYVSYKGGRGSFSGCSMKCKQYCGTEVRRAPVHWELYQPCAVQVKAKEQEQTKEQEDKTDSEVTIL